MFSNRYSLFREQKPEVKAAYDILVRARKLAVTLEQRGIFTEDEQATVKLLWNECVTELSKWRRLRSIYNENQKLVCILLESECDESGQSTKHCRCQWCENIREEEDEGLHRSAWITELIETLMHAEIVLEKLCRLPFLHHA